MSQVNNRVRSITSARRGAGAKSRAKSPLLVQQFMSSAPTCIEFDAPIAWAHDIMSNNAIRHLPVLKGGRIVGMVAMRELHLFETMRDAGVDDALVEDAMSAPAVVSSFATVADVAAKMVEGKLDAVIVANDEAPIGIFTSTDALRALLSLSR
jgi:acetoin utilization protein AcuB